MTIPARTAGKHNNTQTMNCRTRLALKRLLRSGVMNQNADSCNESPHHHAGPSPATEVFDGRSHKAVHVLEASLQALASAVTVQLIKDTLLRLSLKSSWSFCVNIGRITRRKAREQALSTVSPCVMQTMSPRPFLLLGYALRTGGSCQQRAELFQFSDSGRSCKGQGPVQNHDISNNKCLHWYVIFRVRYMTEDEIQRMDYDGERVRKTARNPGLCISILLR